MIKSYLLVLMFSTASMAFGSAIKITSFKFLESGTAQFSPAAEICGELVAPTGKAEMIKIVSDPSSKAPGQYFTWAGKEGKFCQVIATFTGRAETELAQ